MKKLILFSAIAGTLMMGSAAKAQLSVSLNFGTPAYYYDNAAYCSDEDYYYLPEVGAYYDIPRRIYFYQEGDRWMSASCLPPRFNGYSFERGRRIMIHSRTPFMQHDRYRAQYGGYGRSEGWSNGGYRGNGYRNERAQEYNRGGGYYNGGYSHDYNRGGYNGGGYSHGGRNQGSGYNNGYSNGSNYNNGNAGNNGGYNPNGGSNGNYGGGHGNNGQGWGGGNHGTTNNGGGRPPMANGGNNGGQTRGEFGHESRSNGWSGRGR